MAHRRSLKDALNSRYDRRGSQPAISPLTTLGGSPERPKLSGRTHSAPLLKGQLAALTSSLQNATMTSASNPPTPPSGSPTTPRSRPRSRVSTINSEYVTSQDREQDTIREINIAVLGAPGVGKSTFVQRSLDLPAPPIGPVVARQIPLDGTTYLVRLLEFPLDHVEIRDDDTISWPELMQSKVDGAFTLYDVRKRASFQGVPELLRAIDKTTLPSVLVSCKCDTLDEQRQVDPGDIEKRAKLVLRNIETLQASQTNNDIHKTAMASMLSRILLAATGLKDSTVARRRPMSTIVQPASTRISAVAIQVKASLEQSTMHTESVHARHDSSMVSPAFDSGMKTPGSTEDELHRSFLDLDESQDSGTTSSDSARSSLSDDATTPDVKSETPSDERGYSFDNLVERLLALPKSKADSRFADVFLALYRKFAAPGQLLEAIVFRFESLDAEEVAFMARTVSQLRYLSIIEQWIGTYPGDFAYPVTCRRMRTFVSKISNTRIFTAASKEMSSDLDQVAEDDDTNWACTDRDRKRNRTSTSTAGITWSSRGSTLLDDPTFDFGDNLGSLSLDGRPNDVPKNTLPTDYGALHSVELARKQASSLVPVSRGMISKIHWRTLLDIPSDTIAREMTRIDWTMFSAIRPRDFVRHVSLSAEQKKACNSLFFVDSMISHFNHLRDWVANFILIRDKAKHRVQMLEKLMQVARKLRELNNYNSLGAFLAGINSAAILRLNATRELLQPEIAKDWMKLEILMSSSRSYSAYRLAWDNSSGERIPYVPLVRRDLVAAEQGNKTFMGDEANGRINWRKFEVMGDTIVGIQRAQGLPYKAATLGAQQDDVKSLILNGSFAYKDDETMYERSLQIESASSGGPRGFRDIFKR